MPKYLQLRIPEPCHEDWNKMSPDAQGRFCGSCQKTVTDFTNMSDAQLVAFFKSPKASVCGRFHQEQLEKEILIPRKRIPWIKYFFQFALPAFLLSLKSSAQTGKLITNVPVPKMVVEKNTSRLLGDTTSAELTTIKGTIKDEQGRPVSYATVYIKGSTKGAIADSLGDFRIDYVLLPCTISVSCVGFAATEVHVPYYPKKEPVQITIYPQLKGLILGGAVVVRSRRIRKPKKESKKEICVNSTSVAPTLLVFPNPLRSSIPLNLKWQNLEQGNYKIEVYNVAGLLMKSQKLILEKELKQTSLPISELVAGNYFVRILNVKTGKQMTEQFIVQE